MSAKMEVNTLSGESSQENFRVLQYENMEFPAVQVQNRYRG